MTVWMKPIYQKIFFKQAKPFLRTRKNLIHTRIALRYALELLQSEEGDEDVVIPAVLFHDVGWKAVPENLHLTAFGPNPSNPELVKVHEIEGAKIARTILERLHYPSEKKEEICQIIRGHDSRKNPISRSDRIVKDVDKLWRYSREGVTLETDRFHISCPEFLTFLEGKLMRWFITPTARKIALKEIESRKGEALKQRLLNR